MLVHGGAVSMKVRPEEPFSANILEISKQIEAALREAKARGLLVTAKQSPFGAAPPKDFALARKDGLVMRVVQPASPTGAPPEEGHPARDPDTLARTFRTAFTRVWRKIPGAD